LMEVQQNISAELNESYVGNIFKVIIDRKEGEFFIGRTEFDSPEVDQEVLIPVEYNLKPGSFYNILMTKSTEFDLYGEPVTHPLPLSISKEGRPK
jgi:ribosomal protein S12 methylthiotransferase